VTSTRYAALLAGGYAVLAAIYIVVSGRFAADVSTSVEDLRRIELFKGIAYVAVTAAAIFAGSRWLFARIERAGSELAERDRALLANERRVFAGLLAASIAHDANNVLQVVLMDLDALQATVHDRADLVQRLQSSVSRLVSLNRRLVSAARQGVVGAVENLDLVQAVRDSLDLLRSHEQLRGGSVELKVEGEHRLRLHPLLVHQIVSNLVVNAAEATAGNGRIEVHIERHGGSVALEVHDDGPGIPVELRPRLFDALESTKSDGSGLGLFSVKACAAALGGVVVVGDSPLGGACLRVLLPAGES